MEFLSIIISIGSLLTALFIWIVTTEHNIALTYYALTKNIMKQLRSLSNIFGKETRRELAKLRSESLEREVLPYLIDWRIAAEKFNMIFTTNNYRKYSDTLDGLLNEFKKAIMTLAIHSDATDKTYKAEELLYGTDEDYNRRIEQFIRMIEKDFQPIINKPYQSYIARKLFKNKQFL
jgi:hypothetical protein